MELDIKGLDKLIAKLEEATKPEVIGQGLTQGAMYLQSWIVKNRLMGPRPGVLGVRTGRLRSSIFAGTATKTQGGYEARIGTNVVYARIHEFGGTILPKNKPFLAFQIDGKWKFVRSVTIPARPFMRPALEEPDNQRIVINIIAQRINEALEGQQLGGA